MNAKPLTKLDIAALKQCDDVVFRRHNGINAVEAIKRKPEPTARVPFPQESIVSIQVDAFLRNYHRNDHCDTPATADAWTAFEMLGNYGLDNCGKVATFINALREGDEIHLRWVAGNSFYASMRDAGWSSDSLTAVIIRKGKTAGAYGLAERTAKTTSCYRMVRV